MWGIPRTNIPNKTWGWYVNGGDIFVFWTSDIESCTFLSWWKKLTISMQTGLRPIMDLEGATIVTICTGIILTRSPFSLSAFYLSQILWYHVIWNYVLLYNRRNRNKPKKKFRMLSEFFIDLILPIALWPSASNRDEYREYFMWVKSCRCVRLTLPPSWAIVT